MHIVILGNGIAGITAARHIRKLSEHSITVISAESDYFFSRTALMYIYMGHMRLEDTQPYEPWFWEQNKINLVRGYVEEVDTERKGLILSDGRTINYDKLLIASGSKSNKFGWPGQDLRGVHGMYNLQDLEAIEYCSKDLEHATIVGGGLIGIELAEMFHSRHIPVTFLVREESFWNIVLPKEESAMINRHILEHGIDLRLGTELKEIWGNKGGRVKMVLTNKGEKIPCQFVGLTVGVSPNVEFLHFSNLELGKGILVDDYLRTSDPDVYAAGDCAQLRNPRPGRRPIEAVWYVGRMMGEVAARNIVADIDGHPPVTYNPGIWYNSAKFFDIEYQVYGTVLANPPQEHQSLYWEHPKGKKSIRIVYDKYSNAVLGFNLMGVRYRSEVCLKWIEQQTHIEEVLQNLGLANFDPEFYAEYEKEVIALYNQLRGRNLQLKRKRGLGAVLNFLQGSTA